VVDLIAAAAAVGQPLRVGVIGAGIMGADHANTLRRSVRGAEVTAVADVDLDRAKSAAAGATAYDDAFALIADPAVDAVLIASHDSVHAAQVVAAARAGKAVLCEKPLAPTLAEGRQVLRDIGATGEALLSLGFMRRFDPAHTELKAAIDAGVIGPVLRVTGASRNVVSYPDTTSESIITNSVIHELDSIPWLLGSPVTSVAWLAGRATSKVAAGVADPSLTLLRTADGVLTSVDMYVNAEYGYDLRTEVLGEKGALSLTDPALLAVDLGRHRSTGYPLDWRPRFADAYRLELGAWVASVAAGTPSPLASAADGLAASRVAAAVIASMHEGGRWVEVDR
jgi:myo-inositol 2-dehydrogenase/D-chiro-inositol 1-dehydrogenase